MNKTEKLIVTFLLANIALAGAFHFLLPATSVASIPKTQPAHPSVATVHKAGAAIANVNFATAPDSLDKFRDWARQDSGAALEWASRQPDSDRRTEMLEAACFQIAQDDPARAVILADNLNLTNHATLANVEGQWALTDLSAARDWAVGKPAGSARDELLARVAYVQASTDPENAARFVVEKMTPGDAQIEAVISVVYQWALRDPKGAMAWVQDFPEGGIRDRAVNEITGVEQYQLALSSQSSPQ
ncbi:MAG: hypothetical protein JF609_11830, partial [Verrucomicrobia bacterium]|nr:hypothetical protein [Verrucomicrobiota bacterium]